MILAVYLCVYLFQFSQGLVDLILTDDEKKSKKVDFAFLQIYQIKIMVQWILIYLQIFFAVKEMYID